MARYRKAMAQHSAAAGCWSKKRNFCGGRDRPTFRPGGEPQIRLKECYGDLSTLGFCGLLPFAVSGPTLYAAECTWLQSLISFCYRCGIPVDSAVGRP